MTIKSIATELAGIARGSSQYPMEVLAMAIEESTKGKKVCDWMCGEDAEALLVATRTYLDAMHNRRQDISRAGELLLRKQRLFAEARVTHRSVMR